MCLLSGSNRFELAARRRHPFAHYDWQSMLFSFKDTLAGMESLKQKNTLSGASKAAAIAGMVLMYLYFCLKRLRLYLVLRLICKLWLYINYLIKKIVTVNNSYCFEWNYYKSEL